MSGKGYPSNPTHCYYHTELPRPNITNLYELNLMNLIATLNIGICKSNPATAQLKPLPIPIHNDHLHFSQLVWRGSIMNCSNLWAQFNLWIRVGEEKKSASPYDPNLRFRRFIYSYKVIASIGLWLSIQGPTLHMIPISFCRYSGQCQTMM